MTLKPINECRTVAELLATSERWTVGAYARDKDGNAVDVTNTSATCFCLEGAISKVGLGDIKFNALLKRLPHRASITAFNDRSTYAQVYAKVLELGI